MFDFVTPWTVAHQAPLSMGFSRQEYWSGLPCRPPEDLPNTGTEPGSPVLQADSLLSEPPENPSPDRYLPSILIIGFIICQLGSLVVQIVKNLPAMWETQVSSLGWDDPLEKGMVTYSIILAWRIPWTEYPGRL